MNTEYNKEELNRLAEMSEDALANKMGLICLTIIDVIISIAYLAEAFKGSRSWGYVGLVILFATLPFILGWIAYSRDKSNKIDKHIIAVGFALLYTFVLFTAGNDLVFTYAIPMLVIVTLYLDKRYTAIAGGGVAILNIIDVIRKLMAGIEPGQMPVLEIQGLVMILIVIYLIMTVATSEKYQQINGARLTLEKEKTDDVLAKILSVSGVMTDDIVKVVEEMDALSGSVESTLDAMSEVQSGAAETANSVQEQLQKTQEIQDYAQAVESASMVIKSNIDTTTEAIDAGQSCMTEMTKLSTNAIKSSNQVSELLKDFKETTNKMNQITDLINSVAEQTGLLALNASIEAARAGEAGRGFAVVATEISQLAGQTSGATENIVQLINDIGGDLESVISSINDMVDDNNKQAEAAKRTGDTFNTIVSSIDEIRMQSEILSKSVKELTNANSMIVETVTTISAISEEVSAHSNQTYESSQKNQDIVKIVDDLVNALNDNAKVLQETSCN